MAIDQARLAVARSQGAAKERKLQLERFDEIDQRLDALERSGERVEAAIAELRVICDEILRQSRV